MIIEYLQPDASALDAATVMLRAGYYTATLGAAGLVLFGLGYGHRLTESEQDRLKRWVVIAALLGLTLSIAALMLRVLVLSGGDRISDGAVWAAVMRSRIGDAFYLRAAGLIALMAYATAKPAGRYIAVAGAIGVIASYAAMGHSMLYRPRQEIAALVLVHLTLVAWWIGALLPLALIARRDDVVQAAALIADWSRLALIFVALVVVSGGLLIWHLAPRIDLITGSWWGMGLIAKLVLIVGLMGLAALHKLSLTPALARGGFEAGEKLARSIKLEMWLVLLVFWAVAEMVSVHPIDIGHRIQN
ncbi:MAG: CopD family protein [Bosea sp. (in: a-proteobacteria)]